jgi:hypothetical protein
VFGVLDQAIKSDDAEEKWEMMEKETFPCDVLKL